MSRHVLTEVTVGIVPTDGSVGNAAVGSEPTLGSVGNWDCSIQQTAHVSHHARSCWLVTYLLCASALGASSMGNQHKLQQACPFAVGLTDGSVGKLNTGRLASVAGNVAGSVGSVPSVGKENCGSQAHHTISIIFGSC